MSQSESSDTESYFSDSEDYSSGDGSSGNEADTEGEDYFYEKELDEMIEMIDEFHPYMYEPEKEVQNSSSDEDSIDEDNDEYFDALNEQETRVGKIDWCQCGNCRIEKREIDCLCCQEVDALNSKFDEENVSCIAKSIEFEILCTRKFVLENVLIGFHEIKGDHLEEIWSNRSLRYAAYKQFVWWVFKYLGKGNRRVLPSCVLWKIRDMYPQADNDYVLFSEGTHD